MGKAKKKARSEKNRRTRDANGTSNRTNHHLLSSDSEAEAEAEASLAAQPAPGVAGSSSAHATAAHRLLRSRRRTTCWVGGGLS